MEIPSKEYLRQCLNTALQKFNEFNRVEEDTFNYKISYIPTKKRNFMGIKDGLSGLAEMRKYHVKESATIHPNAMYFQKLYKADGKLMKIDCYVAGQDRLDISYTAHYEDDFRYLFPYFHFGEKSWTCMFVTHYNGEKVSEEYMVRNNQIVYERYDYANAEKVNYYYINYVPDGTCPVLAEEYGYYLPDTLEYIEEQRSATI